MKTIEEEARHINMTIKVLKEQVEVFTSQLEPHDTGHIHTTISTLKHRIGELEKESKQKEYVCSFFSPSHRGIYTFRNWTIMRYMRYAFGAFILYTVGYLGGDIIITSIWMGIAYSFIDLMNQGEI